jgi:uncharacterized protein YndB with AHSA1/START domain
MSDQCEVEVSRAFEATPETVFQMLTKPLDLSYWFCHHAWADPRPGGDFFVRWRNGWWARGVFLMVERPHRIELTWRGKDEPGETNLVFEIRAQDTGTVVKIIHSGFGSQAVWAKAVAEAESSWPRVLENLGSVLTTGIDLREASRPMLGIVPEELTREKAESEGIRVESGVLLAGVLESGGAEAAGLLQGDVLTSVGALAISDCDSLTTTLARYQAGDVVQVGYVRGERRGVCAVELKARPMPPVSFDPQRVVGEAKEARAAALDDLRQALANVSEDEAGKRPSVDKWCIKEILAHLSLSERFTQQWFAGIIAGNTQGQFGGNPAALPEALTMTRAAAPTVEALLERLEKDMAETMVLFSALRPEVIAMKARYRAMASSLLLGSHFRQHANQIKAAIEIAKR